MTEKYHIPGIGELSSDSGIVLLEGCSDGFFKVGKDGVELIVATGDRRVEFIAFEDRTIAYLKSAMGFPAYYPVHQVKIEKPVQAVLMDLDGTSVRSEPFWIWIIQKSIASLLDKKNFKLEEEDIPFVSGFSVSEHLKYCIQKYCPKKTVEEARKFYFYHTKQEMKKIENGKGKTDAFIPNPELKEFLLELKSAGIKIGLVTSGLYEKAWPEILSAFKTLNLGDPKKFYDTIITAGFPLRKGQVGTLGELVLKPHPWLYAESCRVGLGINFSQRNSVIGIEDSSAGVCSLRIAGFPTIGIDGGNIKSGGTKALCLHYCNSLLEILDIIK